MSGGTLHAPASRFDYGTLRSTGSALESAQQGRHVMTELKVLAAVCFATPQRLAVSWRLPPASALHVRNRREIVLSLFMERGPAAGSGAGLLTSLNRGSQSICSHTDRLGRTVAFAEQRRQSRHPHRGRREPDQMGEPRQRLPCGMVLWRLRRLGRTRKYRQSCLFNCVA